MLALVKANRQQPRHENIYGRKITHIFVSSLIIKISKSIFFELIIPLLLIIIIVSTKKYDTDTFLCEMENARMKSGCLPGNLFDGWWDGEFEVRVDVYRGF